MSDAQTDATAVVAAPEVNPDDLSTQEYLDYVGGGWDDSSTVGDVPAFDAACSTILETMPEARKAFDAVDRATSGQSKIRTVLGMAMLALRASIIIRSAKGDYPDTFGTSKAYKDLLDERLVKRILKDNPKLDRPWVVSELKAVRTGYLNESGTRAKGLQFEAIIREAVESNQIPGAEVQEDGKVVIPQFTQKGEPKMIAAKDAEGVVMKDGDGKTIQRQAVAVYTPGQPKDVPAILKTTVQNVIKDRDRKDSEGRPLTKVPPRFGGAPKPSGGGGGKPKDARAWTEEMAASLATFTEALDHSATLFAVETYCAAGAALARSLNEQKDPGLTNPDKHAELLLQLSEMLKTEAAVLQKQATPETLEPFLFQDADKASS